MTIQELIDKLSLEPKTDTVVFSTAELNTKVIHPKNIEVAASPDGFTILLLKP